MWSVKGMQNKTKIVEEVSDEQNVVVVLEGTGNKQLNTMKT